MSTSNTFYKYHNSKGEKGTNGYVSELQVGQIRNLVLVCASFEVGEMNEETKKKEFEVEDLDEKLNDMKVEGYFTTLIIIGVVFAATALALGIIQRFSLLNNTSSGVQLLLQYIQLDMIQSMIIGVVWITVGIVLLSFHRSQKR